MPLTPETWLAEFTANSTTTGSQSDARVIQLNNGNILIAWTSTSDTGAGSPVGTDIIGQIFTPFGTPLGDEIRLNTSFVFDDERDVSLAAMTDGGFISVYEDFDTSSGVISLRLQGYNPDGTFRFGTTIEADVDSAFSNFANPQVAVSSATSAMIVYEVAISATDTDVYYRLYDPSTNALGDDVVLIGSSNRIGDPDITVLSNGNYVITGNDSGGSNGDIFMRIIGPTGTSILSRTDVAGTVGDSDNDREASVTALTDGGFVVAYTNTDISDTDIEFQLYSASGQTIGSVVNVNSNGATENHNEPVVAALGDGGFIVFYDDDEFGDFAVRGQRYSNTGNTVGSSFVVDDGNGTQIDAVLLDDGRVIVTWTATGGNIQSTIVDVRDTVNTTVGSSGIQTGTIGDDNFTANSGSGDVHAWDGNDTVESAGSTRNYFLGEGNDRINVNSQINADAFFGGNGTDTIDWSGNFSEGGITIDLDAGTATGAFDTEVMEGFEIIIGTTGDDTVVGTTGTYTVNGGAGDDTINAGDGNDVLIGGAGVDVLSGEVGNDTLSGNNGNDVLSGGDGNDDLTGQANADDLFGGIGDDTLEGGAGFDELFGGSGLDTLNGGSGNDFIDGGNDADVINGVAGSDIINGGLGNDSILGGNGFDTISGDNGADEIDSGLGNDTVFGGGGNDTILGNAGSDEIFGGISNDVLEGQGGNDELFGGGGADDLFGGVNNDRLDGGGGTDELTGGTGADDFVFVGNFGTDTVTDFLVNVDDADFSGFASINNFSQWRAASSQMGLDVVTTSAGQTVTFENTTLGSFDSADFLF